MRKYDERIFAVFIRLIDVIDLWLH